MPSFRGCRATQAWRQWTPTVSSQASRKVKTTIKATRQNSEDSSSTEFEVVKRASRIEITPSTLSFDETGIFATLKATIYDANDNEMSPSFWNWSSANKEVATVSVRISTSGASTYVQSIGEGTTIITLSVNGSATGTATVTVTLPTARVDISPGSLTFEALGDTKSVTVRVLDENGDEDEDATFGYIGIFSPCCSDNSDDSIDSWDIVQVDGGLEITAGETGRGQLTIISEGVESAILLVTISQFPSALEISPNPVRLAVDGTATLSATIKDANGHSIGLAQGQQSGLVVYWETSDDEVATVEGESATSTENTGATATVTGVAAGSATITGRWGSRVRGTASVTVDNN